MAVDVRKSPLDAAANGFSTAQSIDASTTYMCEKDKNLKLQRFNNFRKVTRSFTTLAYGHAGRPKVLEFDLRSMVKQGSFNATWRSRASVFSMDSSLLKSQLLYMFWFALMTALTHLFLPEEQMASMSSLERFTDYFNVFIPFILGLFISVNIARWWTLRIDGLGAVMDSIQNVILLLNGIFAGPEWMEVHDQILKYGLASITLIVNACRGNENVESLGPKGDNLLSLEELELVDEVPYRARPALMWTWVLMLVSKICNDKGVNAGKFRDIANQCKQARNGISIIWGYLRTQLPFAYVHLVTFMINLNNFFVSIKCGILLAIALKEKEHTRALNQFFFVCIVPPLYQALLTISYVIHDPFGEDLLDFPIMAFQEYTNESAVSISAMAHTCPALKLPFGAEVGKKATHEQEAVFIANSNGMAEGTVTYIEREIEREIVLEEVIHEAMQTLEKSMNAQVESKDEVIGLLRERVAFLDNKFAGLCYKLDFLEGNLQRFDTSSISLIEQASGNGWCATIQRGQPAGPPMAMEPKSRFA